VDLHCTFSHRSTKFSFIDLRPGLHTAWRPGSISGSLVSRQDKGSEKSHTTTHTHQKPLLAPPEVNTGTVWKPSFHERLDLSSLTGRVKEKSMTISACEMLYICSQQLLAEKYDTGTVFRSQVWLPDLDNSASLCCMLFTHQRNSEQLIGEHPILLL